MMLTSIGYHTATIFRRIRANDAKRIYHAFRKYQDETKEISMYVPNDENERIKSAKGLQSTGIEVSTLPRKWRIEYRSVDRKGIIWTLKYFIYSRDFKEYIIEATINPKILTGIIDYISASNENYLGKLCERFDEETSKISDLLGTFWEYGLRRVDFCINFDLKELGIPCTPEQMMYLIKCGDRPHCYEEWMIRDKISHRKVSPKESLYLRSCSTNINCYHKHRQLIKEYPSCPNIEDSLHVIRFEIQCKYNKVYAMKHILQKEATYDPFGSTKQMLSDMTAKNMVEKYYNRIIGRGDYHTLKNAIETIESHGFMLEKEERLIDTLKMINQYRGIAKARTKLDTKMRPLFNRSLRELESIGVNPATIPKSFGIKFIPNLLDTFNTMLAYDESSDDSHIDPFELLAKPFENINNPNDFEYTVEPAESAQYQKILSL